MYKESPITNKRQALANAKLGFLFWRDDKGVVRLATAAKVNASWGIWEFFTCSHHKPVGFTEA